MRPSQRVAFETACLILRGTSMFIGVVRQILVATIFTIMTTAVFGIGYPLVVTGLAQMLFPDQANGSLIERDGKAVGSRLIGQPFAGAGYFWSRPSAAGKGYDATASGGSNLGPTNATLIERVRDRACAARGDQSWHASARRARHDVGIRARPASLPGRRIVSGPACRS